MPIRPYSMSNVVHVNFDNIDRIISILNISISIYVEPTHIDSVSKYLHELHLFIAIFTRGFYTCLFFHFKWPFSLIFLKTCLVWYVVCRLRHQGRVQKNDWAVFFDFFFTGSGEFERGRHH